MWQFFMPSRLRNLIVVLPKKGGVQVRAILRAKKPVLRASDRASSDAGWIVVRCAGDHSRSERTQDSPQQSRLLFFLAHRKNVSTLKERMSILDWTSWKRPKFHWKVCMKKSITMLNTARNGFHGWR